MVQPAGLDTDVDGGPLAVSAIRTGLETGSGTAGTVGSALSGTYGTLTLNADGSYTYVADKANALGRRQRRRRVHLHRQRRQGRHTAELRIAVTGTNDARLPPTTPARSPKTPPPVRRQRRDREWVQPGRHRHRRRLTAVRRRQAIRTGLKPAAAPLARAIGCPFRHLRHPHPQQ